MASVMESGRDIEIISTDDLKKAIKKGLLEDVKRLIGRVSSLITEFCTMPLQRVI